MYLYRTDNINSGAATTARINGKNVDLYEKDFADQDLIAAGKSGWCSLETLRRNQLDRAIPPKGRNGLT